MNVLMDEPAIHIRHDENHMATTFEFLVSCVSPQDARRAQHALQRAHDLVRELESKISEFRAESDVFQLNQSRPFDKIPISSDTLALIKEGERIYHVSHGHFNCTAKGPGKIHRDSESNVAWRDDVNTHLGFGAIGKGYALDRVRALLEQEGFQDYLLSAGGSSVILSGFAARHTPWSWGWSWKKRAGGNLGIALRHSTGKTIALGISGTHEKGSHLLSPSPLAKAPLSALVAHPSAATADALSTALFVAGWDDSWSYLGDENLAPAVAVIEEGDTPRWNGIFQNLWGSIATSLAVIEAGLLFSSSQVFAEESVDLGSLGLEKFNPYGFERNSLWVLLPTAALLLVAIHLKRTKKKRPQ